MGMMMMVIITIIPTPESCDKNNILGKMLVSMPRN
jgi:hypothetical protein